MSDPVIASKPLVALDHVGHSFDDGRIGALKDVSFTIREGNSVAIVGASGSGKSTLILLFQATVTPIQATAMAVRITALIRTITDALLAELIGDGTAGTEKPVPARTHGAPHSRMLRRSRTTSARDC